MPERSYTTPRRRGPKHPLPPDTYQDRFTASESPYYTIDNTQDIFGTTLLPSQRCYVDPWDLENYDYVRKKISRTPSSSQIENYYESSMSPSPVDNIQKYHYYRANTTNNDNLPYRMSSTMPRNMRRKSQYECEIPYSIRSPGLSSSSSTGHQSSIGEEYNCMPNKRHANGIYSKSQIEYAPTTPSHSSLAIPPIYDYCNPYATLPYCSASDCYECFSQAHTSNTSFIYTSPSIYNNNLGCHPYSSLYSGIYANKFGLSKKGLLQIDYSCSWNDLDRIMGRQY